MAVGGEKSTQDKIITQWSLGFDGSMGSLKAGKYIGVGACYRSSGAMVIEASIHRFLRTYRVFFVHVHILVADALEGPFQQSNLYLNGNLTERVYCFHQQRHSPQICLNNHSIEQRNRYPRHDRRGSERWAKEHTVGKKRLAVGVIIHPYHNRINLRLQGARVKKRHQTKVSWWYHRTPGGAAECE